MKLVACCLITLTAAIKHSRKHWYIKIGIVIHLDFPLSVVKPVKATYILGNRPAPGDGESKKKGVQSGIVKPLAGVGSCCQQQTLLIVRNDFEHRARLRDFSFAH